MKKLWIACIAVFLLASMSAMAQDTGLGKTSWKHDKWVIQKITFKGAAAISGTLDNAAAVDAGSGVTTIPMTGHGFLVNSWVYIQGSTNYDGFYLIQAVAANTFNINHTYVAETFAGTEYAGAAIGGDGRPYELNEVRLHLSAASASEYITGTLDSGFGSQFDVIIKTQDMNGLTDWDWSPDANLFFESDDIIKLTYANTNTRTYGIEVSIILLKEEAH